MEEHVARSLEGKLDLDGSTEDEGVERKKPFISRHRLARFVPRARVLKRQRLDDLGTSTEALQRKRKRPTHKTDDSSSGDSTQLVRFWAHAPVHGEREDDGSVSLLEASMAQFRKFRDMVGLDPWSW